MPGEQIRSVVARCLHPAACDTRSRAISGAAPASMGPT